MLRQALSRPTLDWRSWDAAVLILVMAAAACGGTTRAARPAATVAHDAEQAEVLCDRGRDHLAQRDYEAAATWLDRCIEMDPGNAYAYYYAGLAYSELNLADQMINRFERFVQLAPDAPERPRVESLLASTRR